MADVVLSDAEVAARLGRDLPRWERDGDVIRRRYSTGGWKATMMAAGAVAHLAEAAWHHPDLVLTWGTVEVRLSTHSAGGITEKDLALAARIEDVVAWRPGTRDGPLDGTPDDPRWAHVLPDE